MGRASSAKKLKAVEIPAEPLRLDFGCGMFKRPGFKGVDRLPLIGVDFVVDVRTAPWPWDDASVVEAHCSHFLEHLDGAERMAFFNELYRVLQPNATCQFIVPHWNSPRAYGDPTHKWPPVCEWTPLYLSQQWRDGNAPHTDGKNVTNGYRCNFAIVGGGYNPRIDLQVRSQEYQEFALGNYKGAADDYIFTLQALK